MQRSSHLATSRTSDSRFLDRVRVTHRRIVLYCSGFEIRELYVISREIGNARTTTDKSTKRFLPGQDRKINECH